MANPVTVLIPSYNPGKYLVDALESVFKQSHQDWELVLVDDASVDSSLELVEERLADPRLRVLRKPQNLGQSRSLNRGLEVIRTEFFLQFDTDDWLEENAIERFLVKSEDCAEDVALIVSNVYAIDERTGDRRAIRQAK